MYLGQILNFFAASTFKGPCGWVGHVSELDYRPAAAWGQAALAIHDAGEAQLTPQARGWLDEALGAWCFVWRRP